jgi:hypothetical protein
LSPSGGELRSRPGIDTSRGVNATPPAAVRCFGVSTSSHRRRPGTTQTTATDTCSRATRTSRGGWLTTTSCVPTPGRATRSDGNHRRRRDGAFTAAIVAPVALPARTHRFTATYAGHGSGQVSGAHASGSATATGRGNLIGRCTLTGSGSGVFTSQTCVVFSGTAILNGSAGSITLTAHEARACAGSADASSVSSGSAKAERCSADCRTPYALPTLPSRPTRLAHVAYAVPRASASGKSVLNGFPV